MQRTNWVAMIRRTLTILSLVGLVGSVVLWGVSVFLRGIPWAWYYDGPPWIITRAPQAWIVISAVLLCNPEEALSGSSQSREDVGGGR